MPQCVKKILLLKSPQRILVGKYPSRQQCRQKLPHFMQYRRSIESVIPGCHVLRSLAFYKVIFDRTGAEAISGFRFSKEPNHN
jgi:hypothetical protein